MSLPSELKGPFVVDGGQFAFSAIGNVLITSQNGELSVEAMQRAGELHQEVLARYPRGTCMISHLSTMKVPSVEVRSAIADSMARFGATTMKRAIVLSDDGFVASIVRSVLGGMAAVDRSATTQRYFSALPDAADFLSDVAVPASVSPEELLKAARETVDAHDRIGSLEPSSSVG